MYSSNRYFCFLDVRYYVIYPSVSSSAELVCIFHLQFDDTETNTRGEIEHEICPKGLGTSAAKLPSPRCLTASVESCTEVNTLANNRYRGPVYYCCVRVRCVDYVVLYLRRRDSRNFRESRCRETAPGAGPRDSSLRIPCHFQVCRSKGPLYTSRAPLRRLT